MWNSPILLTASLLHVFVEMGCERDYGIKRNAK